MTWFLFSVVLILFPVTLHADQYPDKRIFSDDQGLFDLGDDLVLFDGLGMSKNIYSHLRLNKEAWPFPRTTYFGMSAKHDLNNVSLEVDLLVEPSVTSEQLRAARCGILWKWLSSDQAPQIFPVQQTDSLQMWLPSLRRDEHFVVLIGWPEPVPDLVYMMTKLRSAEGTQLQPWHDAGQILRRRKEAHPAKLRTVRLQDICDQFVTVPTKS